MANKNRKALWMVLISLLGLLLILFALWGCASSLPIAERSGAQLWGENCGHCHNIRPPTSLSDAEWDLAVHHMRTRANLSAVEAEKILEFLQQSN